MKCLLSQKEASLRGIGCVLLGSLMCPFFMQGQNLSFEEQEFDFGTFCEDKEKVSHSFSFENNGDKTLILYDVVAGCGCTTPEWSKAPIPAGGKGEIKVTYNAIRRIGAFKKSIKVKSNAMNGDQTLYIKGNVFASEATEKDLYPIKNRYVEFSNSVVTIGGVDSQEGATSWVEFINKSDKPISIETKESPEFLFILVSPKVIKPQEKGTIFVTFLSSKCKRKGVVRGEFTICCKGEKLPSIEQSFSVETSR